MQVLFIGDVVGKVGRRAVAALVPRLRRERKISLCIANGENVAGGMGITPGTLAELYRSGVDVVTNGNHVWKNKEIIPVLGKDNHILRPANYPAGAPGFGSVVLTVEGTRVGVLNLEGRVFMQPLDCPFQAADREIAYLSKEAKVIIVDIHAETTSEKIALGRYLDGKVSAVIGTHTHVQTADARVLPGGTLHITDVGMAGAADSVIGMRTDVILERFTTRLPVRFQPAGGKFVFSAVCLRINAETGRGESIERILEWEEDSPGKEDESDA